MNIQIREATPAEYAEAGAVTASAYREFVRGGDWEDYLESIADVEGRADRTAIVIALDGTRIVGSATLELTDRVEPDDDPALDVRLPTPWPREPAVKRTTAGRPPTGRCATSALPGGSTGSTSMRSPRVRKPSITSVTRRSTSPGPDE